MSPKEIKELPRDEQDGQNEIGVLSDDEEIAGEEPEPPEEPDVELVDVEVEDIDDVPLDAAEGQVDDEEEDDNDDEEAEEENSEDDDEEDSSEGRKEEDDDSDDEDENDDKRPFNDSDNDLNDDDEEEDTDEDNGSGGYSALRKGCIATKRNTFSKGKVMPGASFPLTSNQGYKGDIEDLIRAAAQAEGEMSSGQDQVNDISCLDHESFAVPEITIKAADDIECDVVDVIEVENEIEETEDEENDNNLNDTHIKKGPILKETQTLGEDEDPPQKRMKNS